MLGIVQCVRARTETGMVLLLSLLLLLLLLLLLWYSYHAPFPADTQIWALNPDGSSPRPLTSLNQGTELAAHPAWSPDGTRLAFSGMQGSNLNIWIREADGSLRQLTHSVAPTISIVPAWMPDGKRIVFESNRAVPPADSTPEDPYDVRVPAATGVTGTVVQVLTLN
jgi:Tol biopolymer transport system component